MVTRTALAREIGVNRATLWRWETAGLIPAARHPNSRRALYPRAEADAIRAYARAAA